MEKTNHRSGLEPTDSFSQEEFAFAAFDIACAEFNSVENGRPAKGVSHELRQQILERGVEAVSQKRLAFESPELEARFNQTIDSCLESNCLDEFAPSSECAAVRAKRSRFISRLTSMAGVAVCVTLLCIFAIFHIARNDDDNPGYTSSDKTDLPSIHRDLESSLVANEHANRVQAKRQSADGNAGEQIPSEQVPNEQVPNEQVEERSMRFTAVKGNNAQRWGEIVWDSTSQSGQATLHGLKPNFDTKGIRLWRYRLWINEDAQRSGIPVEAAEFDVANGDGSVVIAVAPRSPVDQVESFHLSSEPIVADGSSDVEEKASENERIETVENDVILEFEASELR